MTGYIIFHIAFPDNLSKQFSHMTPILPPPFVSFSANHQEACYEGSTQAGSRYWCSCPSQEFLQGITRRKEEETCRQTEEGCSKEGYYQEDNCQEEGRFISFWSCKMLTTGLAVGLRATYCLFFESVRLTPQ